MKRFFRSKSVIRSLIVVVLVSMTAVNAWATCPTISGPYYNYLGSWYVYGIDQSCYSVSGSASKISLVCGEPGFNFASGTGQATTSFTLTSSDPIIRTDRWDIGTDVTFTSPGGTSSDRIEIDINVTHPNNTVSYYTNFYWSGVNGNLSCYLTQSYFSANTGDTVQIVITGVNSGTATVQAEIMKLTNDSF